ncbi:hypothetical protein CXQ82_28365 [Pseudomonas sp. S09G 359]|nr:hypothetical protein CXQ82_28365 [Pseudomonas sp. S09G 359]
MWERACSRMRSISRLIRQLTDCIREQARSHTSPLPHGFCGVIEIVISPRWPAGSTSHEPGDTAAPARQHCCRVGF